MREKVSSIFKNIKNSFSADSNAFLLVFLISMIILAYIVPTFIFQAPSGTDVFVHMVNTERMSDTYSITDFYEKSFSQESLSYDYPLGLWFYSSIVMKVTGMDIYTIVYVLPLLLMILSALLMYVYTFELLASKKMAILSIIFFLSMPLMAISMLNFSTSRFTTIFLIAIIFLSIRQMNIRNFLITGILVFTLAFTHTGTFMFLMLFSIMYFILSALVWKKFDRSMYFLIVFIFFIYIVTVGLFPFIQAQYIDKGRMIISISESISSVIHLGIIKDMGQIFYENIYVSNNFAYFFFWSALIYAAGRLAIIIHVKCKELLGGYYAGIPLISNIKNVSHGMITAPFWMGPLHSVLSIFGFFQLDMRGKCVAIALIFAAILPGAMQSGEGTGALREIYYLFLIVPVCAAAGFCFIFSFIENTGQTAKRKKIIVIILLIMFLSLMAAPIIGSLYYQPTIAGGRDEKENLFLLGTLANPYEGVADFVYGKRIDIYANLTTPDIPSGNEKNQYLRAVSNSYLLPSSESFVKELNSFNIQFLLSSDKTLKELNTTKESLHIDKNTNLDKIISSTKNFSAYYTIPGSTQIIKQESDESDVVFEEQAPSIKEIGSVFLVENEYYKIKLNTNSPSFSYIGTPTRNLLGEGGYSDLLTINWGGVAYKDKFVNYDLNELTYPDIRIQGNTLTYSTTVWDMNTTERWATLKVKYTFYEKAIKREIFVANDYVTMNSGGDMYVDISQSVFAPFDHFSFTQMDTTGTKEVTKRIYPAQDSVVLKDRKYSNIFFDETNTGLNIRFEDSTPYPDLMTYLGSQIYSYGHVSMSSKYPLATSETFRLVQYFAIGQKTVATRNIDYYTSVSPYLYPNAIKPVIVTGYIGNSGTVPVLINNTSASSLVNLSGTGILPLAASQESSEGTLPLYKKFKDESIPYTVAFASDTKMALPGTINPAGFVRLDRGQSFLDSRSQKEEIQKVLTSVRPTGIMFQYFSFNLDSMKILQENKISYAEGFVVSAPFNEFGREGNRNPKIAYIEGTMTDIVLIPVSWPTSAMLRPDFDTRETFTQWEDICDTVNDFGGVAVFLWNARDNENKEYLNNTMSIIYHAQENGMNFTTPDAIAEHVRLMNKISVHVERGPDNVNLTINNRNNEPVSGVTYRIILPEIDNTCPYVVNIGRIARYNTSGQNCILFVTTNVKEREIQDISIWPDISRKKFGVNLSGTYEGLNLIKITDTENNLVSNADFIVKHQIIESDPEGIVNVTLRRGVQNITLQKPGFYSEDYQVNVNGRIYRLTNYFLTNRSESSVLLTNLI
jgi:hypothetical protein